MDAEVADAIAAFVSGDHTAEDRRRIEDTLARHGELAFAQALLVALRRLRAVISSVSSRDDVVLARVMRMIAWEGHRGA